MTNPQDAQARLDHLQSLYRQWLALKPQLQDTAEQLACAMAIMTELETAYFGTELHELLAAENAGQLDTKTLGEYSVLGEDTIWNELSDKDELLWTLLRLCVKHLDKHHQPS